MSLVYQKADFSLCFLSYTISYLKRLTKDDDWGGSQKFLGNEVTQWTREKNVVTHPTKFDFTQRDDWAIYPGIKYLKNRLRALAMNNSVTTSPSTYIQRPNASFIFQTTLTYLYVKRLYVCVSECERMSMPVTCRCYCKPKGKWMSEKSITSWKAHNSFLPLFMSAPQFPFYTHIHELRVFYRLFLA